MSTNPFDQLLNAIPEDLRIEARHEAIGDAGPPDPATLLVYDLLLDRLKVTGQVPDVATGNRIAALGLLLARELVDVNERTQPQLIAQILQILETITEGVDMDQRDIVVRTIAAGHEL